VRHARTHNLLQQGAGLDRVVVIVAKWVCDRLRHNNRPCKVNDRIDVILDDYLLNQRLIGNVAHIQFGFRRHCPFETCR
jgi:hypothetical protein